MTYDSDHLDILKRARRLISDPACWTQGEFCNLTGPVPAFCMLGAIATAQGVYPDANENQYDYYNGLFNETNKEMIGLAQFNDQSTHPEVLDMMDKMIAVEEARCQNV